MPRRFSTPTALRWSFRKRRVGTSRSSPRSTGAWSRSWSRTRTKRTSARGKSCRGKRRRFRSRTPREVARRSTAAGWKAARRRRGGAFSTARFGRASGRIRACTRSGTVGDGAPWIVGQIEDLFGEQGSYLIDFYHVCEYFSAAAKTIAPDAAAGKAWMEAQKDALKTGRVDAVLSALAPHRESLDVSDDQAPARVCHRYLSA